MILQQDTEDRISFHFFTVNCTSKKQKQTKKCKAPMGLNPLTNPRVAPVEYKAVPMKTPPLSLLLCSS